MDCYDISGARIELGSTCNFRVSTGEIRRGTVTAVGVTSYPTSDSDSPRIQWEVLVQEAGPNEHTRKWIPVSDVEIARETRQENSQPSESETRSDP